MPALPAPHLRRGTAALLLLACAPWAQAQLFKDSEARQAIADINTGFVAQQTRERERDAELAAQQEQVKAQLAQLRQSIADIGGQLGKLREEMAQVRTRNEATATELAATSKRNTEQDAKLLARLSLVEPQKVSLDGRDFEAPAEEKRAFDDAINLLKSGAYEQAASALGGFVRRYPGSHYEQAAVFWLGNAQFATRSYADSLATLRAFVTAAPGHPRVPAAWLAISNCHVELKNMAAARKALEDLIKAFPEHEAAAAAKERLGLLRS